MWNIISIIVLVLELLLLVGHIIGRLCHKKINETVQFLALVFLMNLALYLVPYLYQVIELGNRDNFIFGILECITGSIKLFVGDVKTSEVASFALTAPAYSYAYLAGTLLALIATVSAVVEAFSGTLINRARLSKSLNKDTCDLVVGNSSMALCYARQYPNSVLLLPDDVSREATVALIEDGYVVLRRNFSKRLLMSRLLRPDTRYNVIIPRSGDEDLTYVDTFIDYLQQTAQPKNVFLYVEVEEHKAHTIRREVIENSGLEECIFTFSREEIMAHHIIENHPITEYIPLDFVDEDASIKTDAEINMYFLGFGSLSQEIYRQSILNNQLVSFVGGTYTLKPINYYLWDKGIDSHVWSIDGLKNALTAMAKHQEDYLPLPELPYNTKVEDFTPHLRDNLEKLVDRIKKDNTYSVIVIDTGDNYRNIDTASRIKSMMDGLDNYHLFVQSEVYAKDDHFTTYYGDYSKVYNHNVVVNDDLAYIAKAINAIHAEKSMEDKRNEPDFWQQVEAKAEASWRRMNYFTMTSNVYAALNLRTKVNLLGLSYEQSESAEDCHLVTEKYGREPREYKYAEYFDRSVRNSLLAQEHVRWNTYHLMQEFMPMTLAQIKINSIEDGDVSFVTKNMAAMRHSCLTTFKGLDALGEHKAKLATEATGKEHKAEEYDVYKYDEMLITSAEKLLTKLKCKVYSK